MKRLYIFILTIVMLLCSTFNVNAKDTLYSINKYTEENLHFIERSYNKKGQKDGYVVAGEYLKEDELEEKTEKKKYHPILVKYNKEGKKIWEYSSKDVIRDELDYLEYTYDVNGNIDGYLMSINRVTAEKTTENSEEVDENSEGLEKNTSYFIKVDLEGKKVLEKEIAIENFSSINKILPCFNENNAFDGYILTATFLTDKDKNATLIRLDKEFNIIWRKDQLTEPEKDTIYTDIINIYENTNVVGYIAIESISQNEKTTSKLVRFDKEGNKEAIVEELTEYETFNLQEANNGYIIYGLTSNVKVNEGKYSYYLLKYDQSNNEVWESIGDVGVSDKEKIKLLPLKKDVRITKYLLLYQNSKDLSKEVIEIDLEGVLQKKIKKISNDYYHINEFTSNEDVLYFIGYITCPEEDNCDYDTHSLFLISDEDKVIEVEPKTANNISLVTIGVVLIVIIIFVIKKKKRNWK